MNSDGACEDCTGDDKSFAEHEAIGLLIVIVLVIFAMTVQRWFTTVAVLSDVLGGSVLHEVQCPVATLDGAACPGATRP